MAGRGGSPLGRFWSQAWIALWVKAVSWGLQRERAVSELELCSGLIVANPQNTQGWRRCLQPLFSLVYDLPSVT